MIEPGTLVMSILYNGSGLPCPAGGCPEDAEE
jgi:hypothetical protein